MNTKGDFGVWLRQLRVTNDLTQEALAEAVGCATQTVRSFESGRRRPSREMSLRLAEILQVPSDEREGFVRLARAPLQQSGSQDASPHHGVAAAPARRTALPLHREALIGRHGDLERLRHALVDNDQRLVTLLGPGGIGKTRLALQAADDLASRFAAGSAVAFLASVTTVTNVMATIADAVGFPLAGIQSPEAALLAFLHDRELLLVIDNLEHLLRSEHDEPVIALLTAILRSAPNVRLLVTSRERLRLQAEWVIEIGGLDIPPDDAPDNIARSDAVLLFVERARRITGDFALGPHNQTTVARICRRLDGLPLAIELAAAQVSFLPPAVLLKRLDQALPLLEGGARDLPARQRTMRAAIGWSYHLLQPDERIVFERLGVLVGSFSLAAAEAIGAGNSVHSTHVLGVLRSLVDQSLVIRDTLNTNEVRYRLLEPVRQYVLELLEAQEAAVSETRQRHAMFFLDLAEHLGPQMRVPQQKAAFAALLSQLMVEYPNVRAALTWSLKHGAIDVVGRMGWALAIFWWYRGHQNEARTWMGQALDQQQLAPHIHARTLVALAFTVYGGDPVVYRQVSEEALALFMQLDDPDGQSITLMIIGLACVQQGALDEALRYTQRAYQISQQLGDTWLTCLLSSTTGLICIHQGKYAEADTCLQETLARATATHDTWNISLALFNLAMLAQAQGQTARAAQLFYEWLVLGPDTIIVNGAAVAYSLEGIALFASHQHQWVRAARLFGAAEALRTIAGDMLVFANYTQHNQAIATLTTQLGPQLFATAWSEGRALSVVQAIAHALEM